MFSPESLKGKQIDQFRLEQFIGQGAMGIVYKAFDTILNRTVALKLISKKTELVTPALLEARKRLIQEAQAAGRLSHPNIVTIHSYGETEEFQYICMEYLVGKTLAEVLDEQRVLAVEEAALLFEQILMALEVANQEQIVHRDIKPTNIMIVEERRIKVMDFGIAKIPSLSMTTTGTVLGTPYYMSPEQISGQKVDIRSDIFSVGAVFYQVLTGERPFEGESTVTLAYKIVQVEPIPPKVLNVHIPPAIEKICQKALAKDPTQRYQTPREMLKDLREFIYQKTEARVLDRETTLKSTVPISIPVMPEVKAGKEAESSPAASPLPEVVPAQEKPAAPAGKGPQTVPAQKTALKTFGITAVLLLVMLIGVVMIVRLVKSTRLQTAGVQGPASSTERPRPVDDKVKAQIQSLLQQAKRDWEGNPAGAQKLLEQAAGLDPNNFEAVFQLARILTFRKNFPAAIQQYQNALNLNNRLPEVHFNLGYIYLSQENYDLAVKYFESCRALSPPFQDEVLTNLGICYLKQNNAPKAETVFRQALELNPKNRLAQDYLARLSSGKVQGPASSTERPRPVDDKVKAQIQSLLQQAKRDWEGNPAGAQKLLEQAAGLDPNNFEAVFQLARILTFRKNFPAAIQQYQNALNLNNQVPEVYFNLAFIHMNQGDYDLAIKRYESCRTLSPPYQDEVLTNLGICYMKKGNKPQAQQLFKQALGLNPNNELARSYLKSIGG